jgi:hypothetical protein
LSPWVLLALVGGIAVAFDPLERARIGAEALVCGVIAFLYLTFIVSLEPSFGRGGWSVGPRYITVTLPFLACLAAAGLALADRWAPLRSLAHGLVLAGVAVYLVAATTYPHWPTGLANPLYEISFRALGEGVTPPNLGKLVGVGGTESLLPMYALVLGLALALLAERSEARWVTTAIAAAVASGIIFAYGLFPETAAAVADAKWKNVQKTAECRDGP